MGIPLSGGVSDVLDATTGKEFGYGEVGEWAVRTDTAMLGYFGSAANHDSRALRAHDDGLLWLYPGDIVHMGEDGVVFMHDRLRRTFSLDGLEVCPSALESIMSVHPAIAKCVVSGVKVNDTEDVSITDRKAPIANVALSGALFG